MVHEQLRDDSSISLSLMTKADFTAAMIWQKTLGLRSNDRYVDARLRLRESFLRFRERVATLVRFIAKDMPTNTVHDISHLDSLWEVADTVAGTDYFKYLNPAEAFVLGGSILLHDAGMCLAAYPGGMEEISSTPQWRDSVVTLLVDAGLDPTQALISSAPQDIKSAALERTLRLLHHKKARDLPIQRWHDRISGEDYYLLEDQDIRSYYGHLIGQIAESHWWDTKDLQNLTPKELTPHPLLPMEWVVDSVKVACLLRAADAAHLDQRRAPPFLRVLIQPRGTSAKHWNFQTKLGKPIRKGDAIVYSSGQPFDLDEYESWWLCYEMLGMVDRELRLVDILLDDTGRQRFAARRVEGAESPEAAKKYIATAGWEPIDTRLHISNVGHVVEMLGGKQLYGDKPLVALRELIQNAADAIRARRKLEERPENWGEIEVALDNGGDGFWLHVTDNGVGMSPKVMTRSLLDFGNSFWRSPLVAEELPGLQSSGMKATGRFGIGFFSVFMLGEYVRVISRRYDWAADRSQLLEFRHGVQAAPLLREPSPNERQKVKDGGTRVSVRLDNQTATKLIGGAGPNPYFKFWALVASLCPALDVNLRCCYEGESKLAVGAGDWKTMFPINLYNRINPYDTTGSTARDTALLARVVSDDTGQVFGRAWVCPKRTRGWDGVVTVGGLCAGILNGVAGLWLAESTSTVRRDEATPSVTMSALRRWATEQAKLIEEEVHIEEEQLQCAHVIVACGGDVGDLAFCKNKTGYYGQHSLRKLLAEMTEVFVFPAAEVDYDDDTDYVSRSEFKRDFNIIDDLRVFFADGTRYDFFAKRSFNVHWLFGRPDDLFAYHPADSRWPYNRPDYPTDNPLTPYQLFLKIVEEVWGSYDIEEIDTVVGDVNGVGITRSGDVLTRKDAAQ